MSKDTYDKNCLCYKDKNNQDSFAALLLKTAYEYFQKIYRVQNFSKLSLLIEKMQKGPMGESAFDFEPFTKEAMLDDIKLSICFESYSKAILLRKGYLIHVLRPDKSREHYKALRELRDAQRRTPVLVTEFQQYEAITYNEGRGMNVFPCLSSQTVSLGTLLKVPDYKVVLELPQEVEKFVLDAYAHRNNLHYLLGETAVYYGQTISNYRVAAEFVNSHVVDKFNEWCVSYERNRCMLEQIVL